MNCESACSGGCATNIKYCLHFRIWESWKERNQLNQLNRRSRMAHLFLGFEINLRLRVHGRFWLVPFRVSTAIISVGTPHVTEFGGHGRQVNRLWWSFRPLRLRSDQSLKDLLTLRFAPLRRQFVVRVAFGRRRRSWSQKKHWDGSQHESRSDLFHACVDHSDIVLTHGDYIINVQHKWRQ